MRPQSTREHSDNVLNVPEAQASKHRAEGTTAVGCRAE